MISRGVCYACMCVVPRLGIATGDWRRHAPAGCRLYVARQRRRSLGGSSRSAGVEQIALDLCTTRARPSRKKKRGRKKDGQIAAKDTELPELNWDQASFRPTPSPPPSVSPIPSTPYIPASFLCTWLPSPRRWLSPTARQERQQAFKSVSPRLNVNTHYIPYTPHPSSEDPSIQQP